MHHASEVNSAPVLQTCQGYQLLKNPQVHKTTYSLLEDLEPVTRSIVGLDIIVRGAGHVDQAGACKGCS